MAHVAAAAKPASDVVEPYTGKYNIFNPNTVDFVPRNKFLQGLVGQIDQGDTLEDAVIKTLGRDNVAVELKELAQFYKKIKNKGARLPNFSRWIVGMWAGNKDYANFLAKEGQKAAARQIILSTGLEDILRCADTPHFASCFKKETTNDDARKRKGMDTQQWSYYQYLPVHIAEECPGIGIVYVNDENGKMIGRQWMHHARLLNTAEDICVLVERPYGCLEGGNLARLMAAKGVRVGIGTEARGEPIEYIGCFTSAIHHDLDTWSPNRHVRIIDA